jgi:hypothetical protein
VRTYQLTLSCGHLWEETCVLTYQGKPYQPDFRGEQRKCRVCRKVGQVVSHDPPAPEPDKEKFYEIMGSPK